jgi:hypothetical protein
MNDDDDLITLLRENGYEVFVMDPSESAAEFVARVQNQIEEDR